MHERELATLQRRYDQRRDKGRIHARLFKEELPPLLKAARVDGRVLAAVLECWTQLAPQHVAQIKQLTFRNGTLTVRVTDSGAKFWLDRELRSGLESQTIKAVKASLRRIKVLG